MENVQQKVCIFCSETVKENVQLLLNIFYVSANVVLLLCVSQFFLKDVRLLPKDITERLLLRENVQLIFFLCVAASRNISMFFNECAAASEKILKTGSGRKCAAAFLL